MILKDNKTIFSSDKIEYIVEVSLSYEEIYLKLNYDHTVSLGGTTQVTELIEMLKKALDTLEASYNT